MYLAYKIILSEKSRILVWLSIVELGFVPYKNNNIVTTVERLSDLQQESYLKKRSTASILFPCLVLG
jgi:hypothetical protein